MDKKCFLQRKVKSKTSIVLNEKDKAYVDVTDNLTFLKDNSFIWTSEKDGFNHIYHYDKNGKLKKQITSGKSDLFSVLYDRYIDRVYGKVISMVNDIDESKDVAHDIFMKVYLNLSTLTFNAQILIKII